MHTPPPEEQPVSAGQHLASIWALLFRLIRGIATWGCQNAAHLSEMSVQDASVSQFCSNGPWSPQGFKRPLVHTAHHTPCVLPAAYADFENQLRKFARAACHAPRVLPTAQADFKDQVRKFERALRATPRTCLQLPRLCRLHQKAASVTSSKPVSWFTPPMSAISPHQCHQAF